jgi:hypothetical protein
VVVRTSIDRGLCEPELEDIIHNTICTVSLRLYSDNRPDTVLLLQPAERRNPKTGYKYIIRCGKGKDNKERYVGYMFISLPRSSLSSYSNEPRQHDQSFGSFLSFDFLHRHSGFPCFGTAR